MKTNKILLLIFISVSNCAAAQYITLSSRFGIQVPVIRREGRTFDNGDDTRIKPISNSNPDIVTEQVTTFSPYFDEVLIDSFWEEYKTISPKLYNDSINRFIHFKDLEASYLILFKTVYGDRFQLSEKVMFILNDTLLHKKYAQITCKARSAKTDGVLDIVFAIGKYNRISLKNMNFVPFDHAQNVFIDNLCEKDLALVKSKKAQSLLDTAQEYYGSCKKVDTEGTLKRLDKIKLTTDDMLFTSRIFIENDELWILGIYDTSLSDQHLLLGYKLVNKKFKPALVEVIKKSD